MSLILLSDEQTLKAPRVFYIQRWDNKGFTIAARSYYRTEATYVFTNLTYPELKKHWMQGSLMEIPPLLEVDVDSVVMIVDQQHYEATTTAQTPTPRKRTTKKSTKKT